MLKRKLTILRRKYRKERHFKISLLRRPIIRPSEEGPCSILRYKCLLVFPCSKITFKLVPSFLIPKIGLNCFPSLKYFVIVPLFPQTPGTASIISTPQTHAIVKPANQQDILPVKNQDKRPSNVSPSTHLVAQLVENREF